MDLGSNVKAEVKGDILTLTIDLSVSGETSKSGKSTVIGSTQGNKTLEHSGGKVSVGLNVYRPKKEGV